MLTLSYENVILWKLNPERQFVWFCYALNRYKGEHSHPASFATLIEKLCPFLQSSKTSIKPIFSKQHPATVLYFSFENTKHKSRFFLTENLKCFFRDGPGIHLQYTLRKYLSFKELAQEQPTATCSVLAKNNFSATTKLHIGLLGNAETHFSRERLPLYNVNNSNYFIYSVLHTYRFWTIGFGDQKG